MAVNGIDGAQYLLTRIGNSYEKEDCIRAVVVNLIRNCKGGDRLYRCGGCTELWNSINNSSKYRYITERLTIDEAKRDGLLIGDLPVIYDESSRKCEHIAYYMGGIGGYECIHSSASKGCVCGTTLKNGFTHILRHRLIVGVPASSVGSEPETIEETEESTMAQYTGYGIVTTDGGNLNIRSSASTRSVIIDRIPNGERVKILADKGGWYRVSYANSVGYVSAEYITLEAEDDITDDAPTASGGDDNWGVFIPCASREKADEFAEHFAVGVVCQRECDD